MMGCPGSIITTLSISFHVFSMVFLLISNLGGVTEVEKAPWSLVSRLFGKFRGPAAIIPFTSSSPAAPRGQNFHSPGVPTSPSVKSFVQF